MSWTSLDIHGHRQNRFGQKLGAEDDQDRSRDSYGLVAEKHLLEGGLEVLICDEALHSKRSLVSVKPSYHYYY